MFIFNLKVDLRKLFGFDITEDPFKSRITKVRFQELRPLMPLDQILQSNNLLSLNLWSVIIVINLLNVIYISMIGELQ